MSEQVARELVERMTQDPEFAARVQSDPEATLGDAELTEDERRRVRALSGDAGPRAVRLERRLSRSALVFGSFGHGGEHALADPTSAHDPSAFTGHVGHEATLPVGAHGSLSEPVHAGWSDTSPQHAPHGDATPGLWHLPGDGASDPAATAGTPATVDVPVLDNLSTSLERIPGIGELFHGGVELGMRGHSVPSDVLDTFTSLSHSVVSSMTTAVTTSIGDGVTVGENVAHRVSAIRW